MSGSSWSKLMKSSDDYIFKHIVPHNNNAIFAKKKKNAKFLIFGKKYQHNFRLLKASNYVNMVKLKTL